MWKETKVVKNVSQYNFDARYGVYATTDKDDKSILYIDGKEMPFMEIGSVGSYEDKVIVQVDDGTGMCMYETMLFTKDGELLNVVKNTYSLDYNTNLRYMNVLVYKGENRVYNNNLVDIETGEMIFKESYIGSRYVFGNMIFTNENNIVTRYDWDGSILWQHNYEPDFNVKINLGFVMEGVCGGKLWVKSSVDWHDILLAIDVNTGELLKAFSKSKEDTNHEHCVLHVNEVFLNQENGQVMNVYDCVSVIDSGTLNVIDSYYPEKEFEKDIDEKVLYLLANNPYTKYLIYLCIMEEDDTPTCFFIFNTETKQIEFSTRMFTPKERSKGYGITNHYAVQFFDTGYICVHDNGDRLHIFEDVKD
ncbi:MAG: hypothetical protein J6M59_12080 [Bacteroidaceae bacterium]|nr:hypothetical protein [Bacteroidaceae bacterium]